MDQTLPQQRVRPTDLNTHPAMLEELEHVSEQSSVSRWERIRTILRNPIVLVGLTWVVMALLLAREIFAR